MKILIYFIYFILLGCAKKDAPSPDPNFNSSKNIVDKENIIILESNDISTKQDKPIQEQAINEVLEVSEPLTSINKEYDYDQLFPDSVWTEYMTKRGDYLSLIAYKEYNNANEWRRIYQWNRENWEEKGIGPDRDNPNFIYPYRELDLKKPAQNAIEWVYDYYIHIVESGETLWTIAKLEYNASI